MLAKLCAEQREVPNERYDPLLSAAVSGAAVAEPLATLLAGLPGPRLEAVLARAHGYFWNRQPLGAWLFWEMAVSAPVVRAIERTVRDLVATPDHAALWESLDRIVSRADAGATDLLVSLAASPACKPRALFAEALRRLARRGSQA
jgi:hypothetical protein